MVFRIRRVVSESSIISIRKDDIFCAIDDPKRSAGEGNPAVDSSPCLDKTTRHRA